MKITNRYNGYLAVQTTRGMEIVRSVSVSKFTELEPAQKDLTVYKNGKKIEATGEFWISKPLPNNQYMIVDWPY